MCKVDEKGTGVVTFSGNKGMANRFRNRQEVGSRQIYSVRAQLRINRDVGRSNLIRAGGCKLFGIRKCTGAQANGLNLPSEYD